MKGPECIVGMRYAMLGSPGFSGVVKAYLVNGYYLLAADDGTCSIESMDGMRTLTFTGGDEKPGNGKPGKDAGRYGGEPRAGRGNGSARKDFVPMKDDL